MNPSSGSRSQTITLQNSSDSKKNPEEKNHEKRLHHVKSQDEFSMDEFRIQSNIRVDSDPTVITYKPNQEP